MQIHTSNGVDSLQFSVSEPVAVRVTKGVTSIEEGVINYQDCLLDYFNAYVATSLPVQVRVIILLFLESTRVNWLLAGGE